MAENATTLVGRITVKKTNAPSEELLKLDSPEWSAAEKYELDMATTPLANQPSPYIKATRDEKELGKIKRTTLSALHNGKEIFFYISWHNEDKNTEIGDMDTFPDGVALLFPMKDAADTPIKEMGTKDMPTNAWYWRADFEDKPKNQISQGLSTSLYTEDSSLFASSGWKDSEWTVIMGRAFEVKEEAITLAAGVKTAIGVSAWEGAGGERGGVKSFSKEWRDLVLD